MQKTKEKRSKLSGVERMVNRCIQLVFGAQALMCTVSVGLVCVA